MSGDECPERPLFGGTISSFFPLRFQDVSNIRDVPNHQEVFTDPNGDESLIFELLELKHEVEDNSSAIWFLRDIAAEQDAEQSIVLEHVGTLEVTGLRHGDAPMIVTIAVTQMMLPFWKIQGATVSDLVELLMKIINVRVQPISKSRQGREAQNIVQFLCPRSSNLRFQASRFMTGISLVLELDLSEMGPDPLKCEKREMPFAKHVSRPS